MPEPVNVPGFLKVTYTADHRTNFCEVCGTSLIQDPEVPIETKVKRNWCTTCGGYSKGVLVSRSISLQPPNPPRCIKPGCLWEYVKSVYLYTLVLSYHNKRVNYAERNRHKVIPEKYKTGDNAPITIKGAVLANIKLYFISPKKLPKKLRRCLKWLRLKQ